MLFNHICEQYFSDEDDNTSDYISEGIVLHTGEFGVTEADAGKIADLVLPMNGGYKALDRGNGVEKGCAVSRLLLLRPKRRPEGRQEVFLLRVRQ